ncbi:hypothetical protein HOC35_00250 [Candidatus Woesearchaeota archaeon]|jgi:hypothetical protein|nr:hypothetical protein [Candidatus Woesearchaeota archaeon]
MQQLEQKLEMQNIGLALIEECCNTVDRSFYIDEKEVANFGFGFVGGATAVVCFGVGLIWGANSSIEVLEGVMEQLVPAYNSFLEATQINGNLLLYLLAQPIAIIAPFAGATAVTGVTARKAYEEEYGLPMQNRDLEFAKDYDNIVDAILEHQEEVGEEKGVAHSGLIRHRELTRAPTFQDLHSRYQAAVLLDYLIATSDNDILDSNVFSVVDETIDKKYRPALDKIVGLAVNKTMLTEIQPAQELIYGGK